VFSVSPFCVTELIAEAGYKAEKDRQEGPLPVSDSPSTKTYNNIFEFYFSMKKEILVLMVSLTYRTRK